MEVAIAYNLKFFKAYRIIYKDDDQRINSILLFSKKAHIAVASIYGVPNQKQEENLKFTKDFKNLYTKMHEEFIKLKEPPLIIIGGNTNTIWCNQDYNSKQSEALNRLTDYMFNDIIMKNQLVDVYLKQQILSIPRFTHYTENSSSRLDKIFTNCLMLTKPHKTRYATFGTLQTDHLAVLLDCEIPIEPIEISTNNMVDYTFYNENDIKKLNINEKLKITEEIKKNILDFDIQNKPNEIQIELLNEIIKNTLDNSKASKDNLNIGFDNNKLEKKKYHLRRLDNIKIIKNKLLHLRSKLNILIYIKQNEKSNKKKCLFVYL